MEDQIEKYLEFEEMAGMLGMDKNDLYARLCEDGLLIGQTQTRKARAWKLFFIDQGAARGKGGLYHKSPKFRIRVTPKGQKYLIRKYGSISNLETK